jgi:hypothetical protein
VKILVVLLLFFMLPVVYAVGTPCFNSTKVVGNGSMRIYELSWNASFEQDIIYEVFYNFSSVPIYIGNISRTFVDLNLGVNRFGIGARTFNESKVCEGVILYEINMAPTPPALLCPQEIDVSLSTLQCSISYNSTDPNGDQIIYSYFIDGLLFNPSINTQSLPVNGLSQGFHNLSICAFDGQLFGCSISNVNFIIVPVPKFLDVYIQSPVAPFYGDVALSLARVDVIVNDSNYNVNVTGTINKGSSSYPINCSLGSNGIRNCTIQLTYNMDAGMYNINLQSTNGVKTDSYSKSNAIEVYGILSSSVSSPRYDMNQVFNDWVYSQDPIEVRNIGSFDIGYININSEPIKCIGATFSNITVGTDSDPESAYDASNGVLYEVSISRGNHEDFNVFIYNPGRINPAGCNSIWQLSTDK